MPLYDDWSAQFRVLGDATRLRILMVLRIREACVCELAALLPVSQSAVSQHLRRLKQAGLVVESRQKAWVFYRLRSDLPEHVRRWLADVPVDPGDARWLRTHHVGTACAASETAAPMLAGQPQS